MVNGGNKVSKVKYVYIFTNGNTIVWNENGETMPEYEGFILDVAPKLIKVCDKDTNFMIANREGWQKSLNFSWWFEKYQDDS